VRFKGNLKTVNVMGKIFKSKLFLCNKVLFSMKPKVLLFFIIALVYCCSSENTTKTSLTDYIPKNTAVVIKIKNVDSLKNSLAENKILSKITSWDSYKKFTSKQTSFLCSSKAMAEKIIKDQEKTNTNPTLARLYQKLNAKKNTGIILHLEKCAPLIAPLLKEESVLNSSKFADWVSLDLKLNQNKILLNGISIAGDSIPKYLNLFKHTNAVKNKISKIAPIQSEAIQSYSFDDYATFSKNQQQFLKRSAKPDSLFSTVEEVGFVHLKNEKVIILHTYGAENMYDYLTTNKKESYDFQGNEILELKDPALLRKNLAPVIKDYDASFCTVLEDAFVFSSKKDILQTIIKNYKNGATFNKSPLYVCSNSNLAEESSSLYISGAKNLEQLLQKHGTKTLYQEFKKSDFSKVGFTLQTVVDGDFYHTNINLLPIEKTKNNTKVTPLFSLQLKDEIIHP